MCISHITSDSRFTTSTIQLLCCYQRFFPLKLKTLSRLTLHNIIIIILMHESWQLFVFSFHEGLVSWMCQRLWKTNSNHLWGLLTFRKTSDCLAVAVAASTIPLWTKSLPKVARSFRLFFTNVETYFYTYLCYVGNYLLEITLKLSL